MAHFILEKAGRTGRSHQAYSWSHKKEGQASVPVLSIAEIVLSAAWPSNNDPQPVNNVHIHARLKAVRQLRRRPNAGQHTRTRLIRASYVRLFKKSNRALSQLRNDQQKPIQRKTRLKSELPSIFGKLPNNTSCHLSPASSSKL